MLREKCRPWVALSPSDYRVWIGVLFAHLLILLFAVRINLSHVK